MCSAWHSQGGTAPGVKEGDLGGAHQAAQPASKGTEVHILCMLSPLQPLCRTALSFQTGIMMDGRTEGWTYRKKVAKQENRLRTGSGTWVALKKKLGASRVAGAHLSHLLLRLSVPKTLQHQT